MTRPPLQRTRFNGLIEQLGSRLLGWLGTRWLNKSVALIALFLGAYAAANVTSLYLNLLRVQTLGALGLLLFFEALIRLRQRYAAPEPGLVWIALDNFRIGFVYLIVLEAFKLGS